MKVIVSLIKHRFVFDVYLVTVSKGDLSVSKYYDVEIGTGLQNEIIELKKVINETNI